MNILNDVIEKIDWTHIAFVTLKIFLWLLFMWGSWTIVRALIKRFEQKIIGKSREEGETPSEAAKRGDTLARLLQQGIFLALTGIVGLGILRELGISIGPILASAGVVGLAIGFGAQNLVRDVISGFFILLENQVRVGDVAVVNGTSGLVEEVNFRTMVLRDLSGTVHVFPNGTITTLSNMTKKWSGYVIDVGVAYKENLDRVIDVLRDEGDKIKNDKQYGRHIIEPMEIFGVDSFGDSAITIKIRLKTRPNLQWEVGREFRKRLKARFDNEGIEMPFPHRSIYFGEASKAIQVSLTDSEGKESATKSEEPVIV